MGNLLYWAVGFLIVAIVAAIFGFGGAAGTAVEGAKSWFGLRLCCSSSRWSEDC